MRSLWAREPMRAEWVLQTAALERELGLASQAVATLEQALAREPGESAYYEALFDLYTSADAPADAARGMRLLTQQARTHLPEARVTRYLAALEYASRGQWAQAETVVRDLLLEDAADGRAVDLLVQLLVLNDRREEAERLVARRLQDGRMEEATQHAALRLAAMRASEGAWEQVDAWLGRLEAVDRLASPEGYFSLRGRHLIHAGRADGLEPLWTRLRRAYPDHEPDLAYQWAMLLSRLERTQEAERVMVEALKRHPGHADLSNALGYTWADAGRNLSQARELIEQALRAQPGNAAYLDSMGWVLYKQGHFAEAAEYLRQAVSRPGGDHPVLLDHWADVLYRLGEGERAAAMWAAARQRLDEIEGDDDPDARALPARLEAKLSALAAGTDVPVAPLGRGVAAAPSGDGGDDP
jgi:predicted Zn-dependent protease